MICLFLSYADLSADLTATQGTTHNSQHHDVPRAPPLVHRLRNSPALPRHLHMTDLSTSTPSWPKRHVKELAMVRLSSTPCAPFQWSHPRTHLYVAQQQSWHASDATSMRQSHLPMEMSLTSRVPFCSPRASRQAGRRPHQGRQRPRCRPRQIDTVSRPYPALNTRPEPPAHTPLSVIPS